MEVGSISQKVHSFKLLRAPVNEIPQEDRRSFGMAVTGAVMAIAQLAQQAFKGRGMAVNVADKIVQSGSPSWAWDSHWM